MSPDPGLNTTPLAPPPLTVRRPGAGTALPSPPDDLADHQPDLLLLRRVHAGLKALS
ncbi:hypothetical protein [Streptomyces nodosus]|uniref:hypothetical protein n=1 Tax=Streptomyces nodosus TaxID=40318 RepID=UPI000B2124AC|nr:hypothetical protein [Streptomyces nodosus]MBB4795310.1 hypothetical protein [Streptomyces nodosus]